MSHDDFAVEPIPGLPEELPPGETILWQGRPDWWALTRDALAFWWVMGYFAVLAVWRFVSVMGDLPIGQAIGATVPFLFLAAIVAALLIITAVVQSRAALYTVTTARVVMRIGAALTLTLNLPFSQIAKADLAARRDGSGTIAFTTLGDARVGYIVCWPHVRPWRLPTQPALRSIPDAERVARLIAEVAETRITAPVVSARPSASAVAAE
jgi:hypothetical protein